MRYGQAHLHLGLAPVHGEGLVPAGGVAAGTAVQLVLGGELSRLGEDPADLLLGGGHLLARHGVEARGQVDVEVLGVFLGPLLDVAGHGLVMHVLHHVLLALVEGEVVHHRGAADAPLAEQEVEQPVAHPLACAHPVGQHVQHVHHPLGPFHDVDGALEDVRVDRGCLEQPAGDRVDPAEVRVRGVEVGRRRLGGCHPRRGEQLHQLLEGQHGIHTGAGSARGAGSAVPLDFFRHAGADEHELRPRVDPAPHHPGRGLHGRDHGGEMAGQLGHHLLHVLHHGGAGRGDEEVVGGAFHDGAEPPVVLVRDEVGPECHLEHAGEAHSAQRAHKLARRGVEERRGERGCEQRVGAAGPRQQRAHLVEGGAHALGPLRAGGHAPPAGDAELLDDLGLPALHLDGLCRAGPHARVALLARVADRVDRHHGPSPGVLPSLSPSGAVTRSSCAGARAPCASPARRSTPCTRRRLPGSCTTGAPTCSSPGRRSP